MACFEKLLTRSFCAPAQHEQCFRTVAYILTIPMLQSPDSADGNCLQSHVKDNDNVFVMVWQIQPTFEFLFNADLSDMHEAILDTEPIEQNKSFT